MGMASKPTASDPVPAALSALFKVHNFAARLWVFFFVVAVGGFLFAGKKGHLKEKKIETGWDNFLAEKPWQYLLGQKR